MTKIEQSNDNAKFYVRAMTCGESYFVLENLAYEYDPYGEFWDQCVDLENGHRKPQIRIANAYTYFNITRYMLFENIEFTGEDLFAKENYGSNGFMSPWGAIGFLPSSKCHI